MVILLTVETGAEAAALAERSGPLAAGLVKHDALVPGELQRAGQHA